MIWRGKSKNLSNRLIVPEGATWQTLNRKISGTVNVDIPVRSLHIQNDPRFVSISLNKNEQVILETPKGTSRIVVALSHLIEEDATHPIKFDIKNIKHIQSVIEDIREKIYDGERHRINTNFYQMSFWRKYLKLLKKISPD